MVGELPLFCFTLYAIILRSPDGSRRYLIARDITRGDLRLTCYSDYNEKRKHQSKMFFSTTSKADRPAEESLVR